MGLIGCRRSVPIADCGLQIAGFSSGARRCVHSACRIGGAGTAALTAAGDALVGSVSIRLLRGDRFGALIAAVSVAAVDLQIAGAKFWRCPPSVTGCLPTFVSSPFTNGLPCSLMSFIARWSTGRCSIAERWDRNSSGRPPRLARTSPRRAGAGMRTTDASCSSLLVGHSTRRSIGSHTASNEGYSPTAPRSGSTRSHGH
jgi:hypothetical protein